MARKSDDKSARKREAISEMLQKSPQVPGGGLGTRLLEQVLPEEGILGAIKRYLSAYNAPRDVASVAADFIPAVGIGSVLWRRGGQEFAGPLYHGTSTELLPRIMKEGLLPTQQSGMRIYKGEIANLQPGVYFARDPTTAYSFGERAARTYGGVPVVLEAPQVPTSKLLADQDVILVPLRMAIARGATREKLGSMAEKVPWRKSFALPSGVRLWLLSALAEGPEKALRYRPREVPLKPAQALHEEVPKIAAKYAAASNVPEEVLRRRLEDLMTYYRPYQEGIGTVVHAGAVPPTEFKPVLDLPPNTYQAFELQRLENDYYDLLRRTAVERLLKGQSIPWWLGGAGR